MNTRLFLTLAGLLLSAIAAQWSIAQDPADPFGESKAAPARVERADTKKEVAAPPETDPIVLGIRASDPKTPKEVLQAAVNLMNYGRMDEAKRYLAALVATSVDDANCWQLQRQFGSATLIRLARQAEMQPEGNKFADWILKGSNRFVREPARLQALIGQLSDPRPEIRNSALVDLRESGADAAVALIGVLGDKDRSSEHSTIRQALVKLSAVAIGPLISAIDSPKSEVREQSMEVLGRQHATDAVPFLLRPYFTLPQGSSEQVAARTALQHLSGKLLDLAAAQQLLYDLALAHLEGRVPVVADHEGIVEVWRWNPTDNAPRVLRQSRSAASLSSAVEVADELVTLAPDQRSFHILRLTAVLEFEKRTAGWEQMVPRGPGSPFALALAHRELWDDALRFAVDHGSLAAAVGLLEIVSAAGDSTGIISHGNQPREIVRLLRHPDRRVRFAALQAVIRHSPGEPFAGASFVPESLAFFAGSTGARQALISHPRIEVAQSIAARLRDVGFEPQLATPGTFSLNSVLRNADVEFVLLSDMLDRPTARELIRQFRREPRTAVLPIGILAQAENLDRIKRSVADDKYTEVMVIPADEIGVAFVMRTMLESGGQDAVGPDERLRQAAQALDLFALLAEHPERFGFYDLLSADSAVEQALSVPALSAKASRVLGWLASARAQRSLVQFASQIGRPLADRQAAVTAFDEAIKRRGNLLDSDEIRRQYAIYNSSITQDAATQQVLGAILDVIEDPAASPPTAAGGVTPGGDP